MKKRAFLVGRLALSAAVLFLVSPGLVSAQAAQEKPREKLDMGAYKVSPPPGRGWDATVYEKMNGVLFEKRREGLLSQLTNQQRAMAVWVGPVPVNIYGWRSTEEEVAKDLLLKRWAKNISLDAEVETGVTEWGGKKLYSMTCRENLSSGPKLDTAVFLYFPPGSDKTHSGFEFDFRFARSGGMLKLYNNPALDPVHAVMDSLEIVDPLQAVPGPHGDLLRAAAAGEAEGVRQAIEKGADVNAAGPERGALSVAAGFGRREVVDLLVERGAAIDIPDQNGGRTPLLAAIIGREPGLAAFFVGKGADVNRQINAGGGTGVSPLMFAVAIGDLDLVRAIIDAGGNLEARTVLGETALVLAADNGWAEGAALLLERGADVNARMKNGWTALMRAADKNRIDIAGMLLENKADPNLKQTADGWAALMIAVHNNQPGLVKALIDHGAEVDAEWNGEAVTAFNGAVILGLPEIAAMLAEAGADVNKKLGDGWTALLVASENGSEEIVKLLIAKGADLGAKDAKGRTALKIATKQKHAGVVKLLQAAGAK